MAQEIGTAYVRLEVGDPRIQVLALPGNAFALIIDGDNPRDPIDFESIEAFKQAVGATAVLITQQRLSA